MNSAKTVNLSTCATMLRHWYEVTDLGSDSALVILPATDLGMRSVMVPELALDLARVTTLVKAMVLE